MHREGSFSRLDSPSREALLSIKLEQGKITEAEYNKLALLEKQVLLIQCMLCWHQCVTLLVLPSKQAHHLQQELEGALAESPTKAPFTPPRRDNFRTPPSSGEGKVRQGGGLERTESKALLKAKQLLQEGKVTQEEYQMLVQAIN